MEEKRWESCNAEALLDEFFSQDDLRQLVLSTGELLDCPLMVLDDTFRIAAYRLPLGFSDELFQNAVRRGEIAYEAGATISKNAMLTAGWAHLSSARACASAASSAWIRTDIWKKSRRRPGSWWSTSSPSSCSWR